MAGSRNSWLLVIGGVLAVCALNAGGEQAIHLTRFVVALPVVFFLPGFLFLRLLAPSRSFDFETLVLTLGTSIVSTITLGLLLHFFNALTPAGWATGFGLLFLVSFLLRRFAGGTELARVKELAGSGHGQWRLKALPFTALLVAVVLVPSLVGAAATLAWHGAVDHRQFAYTELWIGPSKSGGVTVGVKNQEQGDVRYDLEVRVERRYLPAPSRLSASRRRAAARDSRNSNRRNVGAARRGAPVQERRRPEAVPASLAIKGRNRGSLMRVLMLAQFYEPVIGGEERHVLSLSEGLVARGHEVVVATMPHPARPAEAIINGVTVRSLRGAMQRASMLFQRTRASACAAVSRP